MKTFFASSISFLLLSSSFWNNVSYAATTEENPNCATPLGPFEYPADLVRPSMIWVEGFASRLHAQNIQKYETPIAVWQTWRIDQLMWNCIAAFHPEALSAITKERPEYVGDDGYFDSHTRALCIMHGMKFPSWCPFRKWRLKPFWILWDCAMSNWAMRRLSICMTEATSPRVSLEPWWLMKSLMT